MQSEGSEFPGSDLCARGIFYRVVPNYYTLWKPRIDLFIGPFGTPLEAENVNIYIYFILLQLQ